MEDKHRKKDDFLADLDLAGPAAWDDEAPVRRPRKSGNETAKRAKGKAGEAGKNKRAPRPRKKRGLLLRFISWAFWTSVGLAVAGGALLFGAYHYFAQDLPPVDSLKHYAPPTVTYIFSDDGRVIGEYSHERRFVVPLEDIPDRVRIAFLAVEDAAFYEHFGINPKAILRAFITNLQTGRKSSGGSTITQQVIKTFLLSPEQTYSRKIKEMILAVRLERMLSKDEILYLYLNQIYLGRGAYGVEAAARTYFDKSAADLTIAEAAILAGITQNPSQNIVSNPVQARNRQEYGIDRMLTENFITEQQAAEAKAEVIIVHGHWPNLNTTVTPYFTEHVRRLMEDKFGADSLYNDGWRIYTTVNIEAQREADEAVAQGLWEYGRRRGYKGPVEQLQSDEAIAGFLADLETPEEGLISKRLYQAVVMDVDKKNSALSVRVGPYPGRISKKNLTWALGKTAVDQRFSRGDVIWIRLDDSAKKEAAVISDIAAVVAQESLPVQEMILEQRTPVQSALLSMDLQNGDIKAMVGGRDFNESQFNRAIQSQRQPGSSFKPILYASALDHGFTPGSIMIDAPLVVDDPGSRRRWKPVNSDLKFKGPMSLYSALVSSRNLISIKLLDRIGYEALAQTVADLGITERLPESLTIALGSHGLHMPELISAYSAFANMGVRVAPRYITRIEDRYGNVVEIFEPQHIPSLDPGTACAITWMLRGVVSQGTGTVVKPLDRPVGGKTGTTNDYSDAWFIGFTPELVTAIWVGTDQQKPRAVGEVGGKVAGPIFLYYMREVLKDKPVVDFTVPPEAEIVEGGTPFGICYKAGTVGTGFSETISGGSAEDEFLRGDFENGEEVQTIQSKGLSDNGTYGEAVYYEEGDEPARTPSSNSRPLPADDGRKPLEENRGFAPSPSPPVAGPSSPPPPTTATPPPATVKQPVSGPPNKDGRPTTRLTTYGESSGSGRRNSSKLPTYGEEEAEKTRIRLQDNQQPGPGPQSSDNSNRSGLSTYGDTIVDDRILDRDAYFGTDEAGER